MKEYKTKKKIYKIDYRGVVYQKDGITVTKNISINNGYYYLCGKPLHKIVYELYNGPIPKGLILHHQNICPKDNRPENLVVLTKQEHIQIHKEINSNEKLKKELKSKVVQFFYGEYKHIYNSPSSTRRRQSKKYYEKNKKVICERWKENYQQNKEEICKRGKKYYNKNKEKRQEYYKANKEYRSQYNKQYYETHKEANYKASKKYYEKHKEEILRKQKERNNAKRKKN